MNKKKKIIFIKNKFDHIDNFVFSFKSFIDILEFKLLEYFSIKNINLKFYQKLFVIFNDLNISSQQIKEKEYLEFLGDSLLNITATLFLDKYFKLDERQGTIIRQLIVGKTNLIFLSKIFNFNIIYHFFKNNTIHKDNRISFNVWLEDTFEAFLGIIFKYICFEDLNLFTIKIFFFFNKIFSLIILQNNKLDYMSLFQNYCQAKTGLIPNYSLESKKKINKKNIFSIHLKYNKFFTIGIGTSIKKAKIDATIKMGKKLNFNFWKIFFDNLF